MPARRPTRSPARPGAVGRLAVAAAALALALTAAPAMLPSPASAISVPWWPQCVPRERPVRTGIRLVDREPHDGYVKLILHSRAMGRDVPVDVMLPAAYRHRPRARFPVLYMLNGAGESEDAGVEYGYARAARDRLGAIVVEPDGGSGGEYMDWYGRRAGYSYRVPAWESFHIEELIPWIDAHYRTIASGRGRGIWGISMGGGGAMKYATAHPGTFGAAASFSGELYFSSDWYPPYQSAGLHHVGHWTERDPPAGCNAGDPRTEEVYWRDHDPEYLAPNLKGVGVYVAGGSGAAGPYDDPGSPIFPITSLIESGAHLMQDAFTARLSAHHIPYTNGDWGPGTHSQPYWQHAMPAMLDWMRPLLRRDRLRRPRSFSYRSARPTSAAWGWRFRIHRRVQEFLYLSRISRRGLRATGSGRLIVRTPPIYRPRRAFEVRERSAGAAKRRGRLLRVRSDRRGRLRFKVPLGPSHRHRQTAFDPAARVGWRHVSVAIRAARR